MSGWGTADMWSRSGPRGHWRVMRGGTGTGYVLFMASCHVCPAQTFELCPNMTAAKDESTRWDERHGHAFAAVDVEATKEEVP